MASEDISMETCAPRAPVTGERGLNTSLQEQMPAPYMARAQAAVDKFRPKGTEGRDGKGMSVLQQHVAFFDRNKDGVIYPWETFQGLRAIGFGFLGSLGGAFLINLAFGFRSQTGWIPNPLLPIHIKNIHRCKHGSDSETYDTEGRFEPAKFEAIFSKYAKTVPDALTKDEISAMLRANRNLGDFFGWIIGYMDWSSVYKVGKDDEGLLHRETLRELYDGSLFENIEKRRSSRSDSK